MPPLPKHTRQITPQPVGKAPLPVGAADVGAGAIGRGLGAFGRGLGDIGSTLFQIKKEQIALNDSVSKTKINTAINSQKEEFLQFTQSNPLEYGEGESLSNWEIELNNSLERLRENTKSFPLSSNARKEAEAVLDGIEEIRAKKLRTLMTETLAKQSKAFLPQGLQDAVRSNDRTQIALMLGVFENGRKAAWGNNQTLAEEVKKKAMADGRKEYLIDQSKLSPDEIIKDMQQAKKDLGKKGEDEFGLSAKDYEDVIASALTAKSQAKRVIDEANNQAKSDLYKKEDEGEALTRVDFENAYEDPDEADQHYDEYIAGRKAELKNETNFVAKGDPIILARMEAVIDLNPAAATPKDIFALATKGIGTENVTRLVDRLEKKQKDIYAEGDKYKSQFSTLFNAGYFGDKDKAGTSAVYLEMKRKMDEFIKSQKPPESVADAFFNGLITKDFAPRGVFTWRGGGWKENGFKSSYIDAEGNKVTGFFHFGDIRQRNVDGKVIEEFYAGVDDKGNPSWIPRQ
jgi:hypothetical protein